MDNRYMAVLEDALQRIDAGDASARQALYGQARLALLKQFEADPSFSLERRAEELALFEAAVRQVESTRTPAPAGDNPAPGNAQAGAGENQKPLRALFWLRVGVLVVAAAFAAWLAQPLPLHLDTPMLYVAAAGNALATALVGALIFLRQRAMAGFIAAPILFVVFLAAAENSLSSANGLDALFNPLLEQRQTITRFQMLALKGTSEEPGGKKSDPPTSTAPNEPGPTAGQQQDLGPLLETAKLSGFGQIREMLPDILLGEWQADCDNGPDHRFTLGPPAEGVAPEDKQWSNTVRGLLTGHALAGATRATLWSEFTNKKFGRDVEMPAHPWPGKYWEVLHAEGPGGDFSSLSLNADYEDISGGQSDNSTFMTCQIFGDTVTLARHANGAKLGMQGKCKWFVPGPPDLDPEDEYGGMVEETCRFHRP